MGKSCKSSHGSKSSKSKFMKESTSSDTKSGKVFVHDAKATKYTTLSKSSKGSKRLFPKNEKVASSPKSEKVTSSSKKSEKVTISPKSEKATSSWHPAN